MGKNRKPLTQLHLPVSAPREGPPLSQMRKHLGEGPETVANNPNPLIPAKAGIQAGPVEAMEEGRRSTKWILALAG